MRSPRSRPTSVLVGWKRCGHKYLRSGPQDRRAGCRRRTRHRLQRGRRQRLEGDGLAELHRRQSGGLDVIQQRKRDSSVGSDRHGTSNLVVPHSDTSSRSSGPMTYAPAQPSAAGWEGCSAVPAPPVPDGQCCGCDECSKHIPQSAAASGEMDVQAVAGATVGSGAGSTALH
jgi:hypothetical protein